MTEPLSKEQLDAIRARADAATPGPWEFDEDLVTLHERGPYAWSKIVLTWGDPTGDRDPDWEWGLYAPDGNDAEFIAHARTDIPALLEHIEAQAAEIAALREAVRNLGGDPDQAWYWTDAWQAKEREADEDLRAGRYADADDIDTLLAD